MKTAELRSGPSNQQIWMMFNDNVAGRDELSWHCFKSDFTLCSAKLVSVVESQTCNYSRSEQTKFGKCCVRAYYGCLAELEAWFSLSCSVWTQIICAFLCSCSRAWTEAGSHEPSTVEIQIVGSTRTGCDCHWRHWGDGLCHFSGK